MQPATESSPQNCMVFALGKVAERLGVSEKTVRRMIDDGEITARRLRSRLVVTVEDLNSFVNNLPKKGSN